MGVVFVRVGKTFENMTRRKASVIPWPTVIRLPQLTEGWGAYY